MKFLGYIEQRKDCVVIIHDKQLDFVHLGKDIKWSIGIIEDHIKHRSLEKEKYRINAESIISEYNESNIEKFTYTYDIYDSLEKFIMFYMEYTELFLIDTFSDFENITSIIKDHDYLYHINHLDNSFATIGLKRDDEKAKTCLMLCGASQSTGMDYVNL